MKKLPHALLALAALSSALAYAQTCAAPLSLPFSFVRDVSADGSTLVGVDSFRAFRWTAASGVQDLGTLSNWSDSQATGVSADGEVVVGASFAGGVAPLFGQHFRWTPSGGMQSLGLPQGAIRLSTYVSADGAVVVGTVGAYSQNDPSLSPRTFRWTSAGIVFLQDHTIAGGVSADGSVVVGDLGDGAFRWTSAGGLEDLGVLGGVSSRVRGVSADGSVLVGYVVDSNNVWSAFRWSAAGGTEDLGTLGGNFSEATDVSADGRVVVGACRDANGEMRAFRWTKDDGMVDLGPDGATGVSADGSVVVGNDGSVGWRLQSSVLGETYCRPTVPNSTGCGGIILANGDPDFGTGPTLDLTATLLPQNTFGLFLTSQTQAIVPNAGGSRGTLCLGGSIGRFVGPGQVMNSGASGSFSMSVDLNAVPASTLTGFTAVQPGETWNFQCWHRDVDANGAPTSNFTDAVAITFQ